MARTSFVVAALVTAAAAAPAGAQEQPLAQPAGVAAFAAGPRATTTAGAVPPSVARQLRAEARQAEAAQPRTTPAAGQPVRFSLAAGLAQPMGDFGDAANLGFNVTGSADFRPAGFPFGLRADAQINRFGLDEDFADGSVLIIGGQLNGVFNFPQSNPSNFRPYVLGGIGLHRVSVSLDDSDAEQDPETAVSFGFGGGINFRASTLDSFVEIRYQSVRTDDEPTSFLPIVFGIRF
jgi:opacity protein-like surface antigen